MTNTKVNIKGVDPEAIATTQEGITGVAADKLMTPQATAAAIAYNFNTSPQSAVSLASAKKMTFSVTANTTIAIPPQLFVMSDGTVITNSGTLTKNTAANFVVGNTNGALDTGIASQNTYYYVYAIANASNTLFDAVISTNPTAPTLPSGYTKYVRLGILKTSSGTTAIELYKTFISTATYNTTDIFHTILQGSVATQFQYFGMQFGASIATENAKWLFDTSGNFIASGNITAFSDERIKENIKPIDSALNKVKSLKGVYFNKIYDKRKEIGLIAQEVEKILPEVVVDTGDLKSVAYGNIVAVLIEAIKELSDIVDDLTEKIK